MKLLQGIGFIIILLSLSACQTHPPKKTKAKVTQNREALKKLEPLHDWSKTPITLKENTIVLDVRSQFEYSLSHVDGAIHINVDEFNNLHGLKNKSNNPVRLVRRLALKGINPDSHVIIYGKGSGGKGEEGRVAFALYSMGVKNVQFVSESRLNKWPWSNEKTAKIKNAEPWEAQLEKRLFLNKQEFKKLMGKAGEYTEHRGASHAEHSIKIIDVRDEKEYLGKSGLGLMVNTPDFGAINISWKEFYRDDGRLRKSMKRSLKGLGIKEDTHIILISEKGIRSAATLMALIAFGYQNVSHLEGGIKEFVR